MSQEELAFIQNLPESHLVELVVLPLLSAMGYKDVRYTHGALEHGKDIVFVREDPLDGSVYLAAAVKATKLSGSVSKSNGINEIYYQINQALTNPYLDPFSAKEVRISQAYVICPYPILPATVESIKGQLNQISNRVHFIDGPKLITLIHEKIPGLLVSLPEPTLRYLEGLVRRLSTSSGRLPERHARTLSDVQVPTRLSEISIDAARLISFAHPSIDEHSFDSSVLTQQSGNYVILADVGAGKTTLLQSLAVRLATADTSQQASSRPLPVLISLHLFPSSSFVTAESFQEGVRNYLANSYSYSDLTELQLSRTVLLLDGYDEIPAHHLELERTINEISPKYAQVVLTSRPSRVPRSLNSFRALKLQPFTDQDIEVFLKRWFSGREDHAVAMLRRVRSDSTISLFCRTPLMLTLYSMLAERVSIDELPVRRTDIYRLLSEHLLGSWDDLRQVRTEHDKSEKEYVLERIALRCHLMGVRDFSPTDLSQAHASLGQKHYSDEYHQRLFNELLYRSSLIRYVKKGHLSFSHLSFQEYFAASALVRHPDKKLLKEELFSPWFRGVWSFYFGLKRSAEDLGQLNSKRLKGNGLNLIEFLREADFTTPSLRRKLISFASVDILGIEILTESDLQACAQIGESVLEGLLDAVERTSYKTSRNTLRVASHLNNQTAKTFCFSNPRLLGCAPLEEQLLILRRAIDWTHTDEALRFFESVAKEIENSPTWFGSSREYRNQQFSSLLDFNRLLGLAIRRETSNHALMRRLDAELGKCIRSIRREAERRNWNLLH